MIQFENITVKEADKTILRNITFTVTDNEKVVLYGRSGSGKTTILRTLLGGHRPVEGQIRLNGQLVDKHSIGSIRKQIAYIGQEPVLGDGTIRDVLLLPFRFKANAMHHPDNSKLSLALERVGLPASLLHTDSATVSGGEKQRVVVARALLLNKNVFCIDEATSALDIASAEIIISLFRDKQFTILSVSHDPRWLAIAEKFITIDNGIVKEISTDRSKFIH